MTWYFYSVPLCPVTGDPSAENMPVDAEWVISRKPEDNGGTSHILYCNVGTLGGPNCAILTAQEAEALLAEGYHLSYDEMILGGGDPA